jgi:hypothetical protein
MGRLLDPPAVNLDLNGVRAGKAAEEGDFHVGDDRRCPDDEAFDAHEFIGV